jgi:dihydrofolate reductase
VSRVVVTNHLTLDGVMQSPADSDEDRSGGFEHGGWAAHDNDEVMGRLVLGSGELLQGLIRRDLIDAYVLLIHPVVVGSGRRLFPDDGTLAALELVDSTTTTTGVVIGTYERRAGR